VEELAVTGFRLPERGDAQWRLPRIAVRAFTNTWTSRPWIRPDACRYCLQCTAICPVQAIADQGGRQLRVDPGRCVRCWCCHEVCPHDAIGIREGAGLRAMKRYDRWRRKLHDKDTP
jgi:Fe-S-cluster-containing hydrogenase component 2